MCTNSMMVALILGVAFLSAQPAALALCDAKPPYRTVNYNNTENPPRSLRGEEVVREFRHLSSFLTDNPNTVTRLVPWSPGDCTAQVVLPICSELEIQSSNSGGALMTLKNAGVSGSGVVVDSLPLHVSGANIDYLKSDGWPLNSKRYVFFVYLQDEPVSATEMTKKYLVEAFDTKDAKCEKFRPDTHPGQISSFPVLKTPLNAESAKVSTKSSRRASNKKTTKVSKLVADYIRAWETDVGQGHEGH